MPVVTGQLTRQLTRQLTTTRHPSSISFSGAGYLGCYHLGVIKYLQDTSLLLSPSDSSSYNPNMPRQTLCGSSAGSLVSAGVLCGLTVDDTMPIVSRCAKKAREAGVLTSLTPGFSLVDVLDPILREAMKEALERQGVTGDDVDGFIRERVNGGKKRSLSCEHCVPHIIPPFVRF